MKDDRLKPLLLVCQADSEACIAPEALACLPFVRGLEIAVSQSALNCLSIKSWAGSWPIFLSDDAESFLARLPLFHCLIVSPLSLNTLAKFALGLRDSFPSRILSSAMQAGTPILLDGGAIPDAASTMNPHFLRLYRRYWEDVQGSLVKGFSGSSLEELLAGMLRHRRAENGRPSTAGRVVITRDDVVLAGNSLSPLLVPRGALITDLAREEAEKRGVVFSFENGPKVY